jgi:hypothetical protein
MKKGKNRAGIVPVRTCITTQTTTSTFEMHPATLSLGGAANCSSKLKQLIPAGPSLFHANICISPVKHPNTFHLGRGDALAISPLISNQLHPASFFITQILVSLLADYSVHYFDTRCRNKLVNTSHRYLNRPMP